MKDEQALRAGLRQWVVTRSGKLQLADLSDDTPILERRIITSLQVMDLILYIEEASGRAIDVARLKPGAFRDIDTIWKNFFAQA